MSGSIIAGALSELGRALLPLTSVESGDDVVALLAELGWDLPDAAGIDADVADLVGHLEAIHELVEALDGASGVDVVVILLDLISEIEGAVDGMRALLADIEAVLTADALTVSGVSDEFVGRLVDLLVTALLRGDHPGLFAVLSAIGLIELEQFDADPATYVSGALRHVIHWDRFPQLANDRIGLFEEAFGWGPELDADALVDRVDRLARAIALPGGIYRQDPDVAAALGRIEEDPHELRIPIDRGGMWPDGYYELGLGVAPLIPGTPGGAGLALIPYFAGEWRSVIDLPGGWTMQVTGDVDEGVGPAAVIRPPSSVELHADVANAANDGDDFDFEVSVTRDANAADRIVLFGAEGASRLDVGRISFDTSLLRTGGVDGPGLSLTLEDLALSIGTGGADTFARVLLPNEPLGGSFDIELAWSPDLGLRVNGGVGVDVTIPVMRALGPVLIEQLHITVVSGDTIEFEFTGDLIADLLVFAVAVERFGLRVTLSFPPGGGNLGPMQLDVGVAPPRRVSFEIHTGAVDGAGFVEHFPETGRYLGGLSLDILSVGIDALVIVDTQLPGDPDGWAFFGSLTAQFPGIPLGFGFTLNGVGGLIALNRTLDVEALAIGLRSGAVDDVLFPADPVGDALALASRIDEYFPLSDGSTVVGPIIEIGWGSPTLVTGQLGIVISLPDGVVAVLGSLATVLPDPDAPILQLHMDSLGVIDVPAGTFWVQASLYDSTLLGTIHLSGDMATYLSVGAQPYFLMSVGGYHPGWDPPSMLPASMTNLRRMRATIDIADSIGVSVQAYFAITANSVQFGSSVNLVATADVGLATYTARGWLGFDVLLAFNPLRVSTHMYAGVGIYSGTRELMGVQLDLLLEGPKPWYAIGDAVFKFFGLDVHFRLEVGGQAPPVAPPLAHPRADVIHQLRQASAWRELAPTAPVAAAVTYRTVSVDDTTAWVRPDHLVAVSQGIAPLHRRLDVVGSAVPAAGEDLIEISASGIDGVTSTSTIVQDWFAPAQFEALTDAARLARASYELMDAGVSFGVEGVAVTTVTELLSSVDTGYEVEDGYAAADDRVGVAALSGAVAYSLRQTNTSTITPRFEIAPTTFTVARTVDGGEAGPVLADAGLPTGGTDQRQALAARSEAIASAPGRASKLVVVPATAILEEVSA